MTLTPGRLLLPRLSEPTPSLTPSIHISPMTSNASLPRAPHLLYHTSLFAPEEFYSDDEDFLPAHIVIPALLSDSMASSNFNLLNMLNKTSGTGSEKNPSPDDPNNETALMHGSQPWANRNDDGVVHATFNIPAPARNQGLSRYTTIQSAIGMTDPVTRYHGKEYVKDIRAFLQEKADARSIYNNEDLKQYWDSTESTVNDDTPFCFDITSHPTPTAATGSGSSSVVPTPKRTKTADTAALNNEVMLLNNFYNQQANISQQRHADMELLVIGKVSSLADPKAPSSKSVTSEPSLLERLSLLEHDFSQFKKESTKNFDTFVQDTNETITVLQEDLNAANATISDLQAKLDEKAQASLSGFLMDLDEIQFERTMKILSQQLLVDPNAPWARLVNTELRSHLDTIVQTQLTTTRCKNKVIRALKADILALVQPAQEESLKKEVANFLSPKWIELVNDVPKQINNMVSTQLAISTPTPTQPESKDEDMDFHDEAKIVSNPETIKQLKQQWSQDQRENGQRRRDQQQLATRVAAYLSATTNAPHKPDGGRVIRDYGTYVRPIPQKIFQDSIPLMTAWEESRKQHEAAATPPTAPPAPPPPAPAYPLPAYPYPQPPAAPQQYYPPAPPAAPYGPPPPPAPYPASYYPPAPHPYIR